MKFVDLVREYTSSSGVGPIVLDTVVNGFQSFADAFDTGDEFYYSIISLDHPTESEVGTGTLQADGSIARAPVGGATNFSPGVKTIASVVGADWFSTTEDDVATAIADAAAASAAAGAASAAAAGASADAAAATAAVAGKLTVADDPAWGVGGPKRAVVPFGCGDLAVEGAVHLQKGTATRTGFIEFDLVGFAGGASLGATLSGAGRILFSRYGTIPAFEFSTAPYVGNAVMLTDATGAPLASPTFTGTPAAPTAAPGTNTTQLATTAFVNAGLALYAPLAGAAFSGAISAPNAYLGYVTPLTYKQNATTLTAQNQTVTDSSLQGSSQAFAGFGFRPSTAFLYSANTTKGVHTAVNSTGSDLGNIEWYASDGTEFRRAAYITGRMDNTTLGTNGWQGRILFLTGAPSTGIMTQRMAVHTLGVDVTGALTATGALSASNFSGTSSGTNTGDQTIVLNGDVSGSGTGTFTVTIGANKVTRGMLATAAAASIMGATAPGAISDLTPAQAKTILAITEADVANLTTDLAAKAPVASPQFTGVTYYQQPTPTAKNATATLTIAELLTLIITSTSASAVSLTLPTGTLSDAGILAGALAVNEAFEWYIINLGSSTGAVTVVAGVGHTLVGNAVTAISTSSRWLTRKTATNTFVTYRIA